MKIILFLFLLISFPLKAEVSYCGAYASIIGDYIYSNAIPDKRKPCPGSGCPGIVKYSGVDIPQFQQVVAENSLIDDVFTETRMMSRPSVARDGSGLIGISMVMESYPGPTAMPALLRSQDGINFTYLGKLKGEPEGIPTFASGMGLLVEEGGSPKYRFYTDGYGVKTAQLTSNDGEYWKFVRKPNGQIKEIAPLRWTGSIFQSIAKLNGIYYLFASDGWPVTKWQYAYSRDGVTFTPLAMKDVYYTMKNVNLFVKNNTLYGFATVGLVGKNCYLKEVIDLSYLTGRVH